MLRQKRGQITIFIVIGIILLFSSALIFYIRNQVSVTEPPVEDVVEEVPLEIIPIQEYVHDCLDSVGTKAIVMISENGGYINTSGFKTKPNKPTESEALQFYEGSDYKLPYWRYMESSNDCNSDCTFLSRKPDLYGPGGSKAIEGQLGDYVESQIKYCLEDFLPFVKQGFTFEEVTKPEVTATIGPEDVSYKMEYSIDVSKLERSTRMTEFTRTIPVKLPRIYGLADEITRIERDKGIFERVGMNTIAIYSGLDNDLLPPLSEMRFTGNDNLMWTMSGVSEDIKPMLSNTFSLLQLTNTSNYARRLFLDPHQNSVADNLIYIMNTSEYEDLEVEFSYIPWWPIYLDVSPSSGQSIRARQDTMEELVSLIPSFNMIKYQFAYDLSWPVLVEITDPSALDYEGLTFVFALEANIRNNQRVTGEEIITQGLPTTSNLCNELHLDSGNVTFNVTDGSDGGQVDNATVLVDFGGDGCRLGRTGQDGEAGVLVTKMPTGIGTVTVSSAGYSSYSDFIAIGEGMNRTYDIVLYPEKTVEVTITHMPIRLKIKTDQSSQLLNYLDNLDASTIQIGDGTYEIRSRPDGGFEAVTRYWYVHPANNTLDDLTYGFTILEKVPLSEFDNDKIAVVNFNGSASKMNVSLVPGTYTIQTTFFYDDNVTIPEHEEKVQTGGCCLWKEYETNTIDAVSMYPFTSGGVELDDTTGYFNVSAEDLYAHSKLRINGLVFELYKVEEEERLHDDLEILNELPEYYEKYRDLLEPEFYD